MLNKQYDLVALYSGGLDSILAVKLLTSQGLNILAVKFVTLFMSGKMQWRATLERDDKLGCDILTIPVFRKYVHLVQNPKHGYGANINPCIDCKIYFLKRAGKIMKRVGAKGLVTGEVLGQRPMSQNKQALGIIEQESGSEGKILRPISALLLNPTEMELSGLVNREKLLAIKGRSRKETIIWARELGITEFPSPAGGCLLTDPSVSKRIADALKYGEKGLRELEALKYGRHFRLPGGTKLIVSRDDYESRYLTALLKKWIRIEPAYIAGLQSFISPYNLTDEDIALGCEIALRYNARGSENIKLSAKMIYPDNSEKIKLVLELKEKLDYAEYLVK